MPKDGIDGSVMELLDIAVVDITTLVATCHALRARSPGGDWAPRHKLRKALLTELKRGTVAYIDSLARSKRGVLDDGVLARCRSAAERQMSTAIRTQAGLQNLMSSEAGALAGMAAARHDLWRLSHMALHLRQGMDAMRDARSGLGTSEVKQQASRLRRRFRRALIAYARVSLRGDSGAEPFIRTARGAALAQIGKRGVEHAARLARLEARRHRAGGHQTPARPGFGLGPAGRSWNTWTTAHESRDQRAAALGPVNAMGTP